MSENRVNKLTLVVVLLVGIIVGGMVTYMVLLPQRTVVEVTTSQPGDPVTVQILEEKVQGLIPLIYGAMGASLVSALAAIVCLMMISRRLYE